MPKGWPDFTVPITIEAVTIEKLPVDIKAQTIAQLDINIAAQSVGNLNVMVTTGTVDTRIGRIINPDFEDGEHGWVFKDGAEIGTLYFTGWKSVYIPSDSYGNIDQAGISPPIDTNKILGIKAAQTVNDVSDYTGVTLYYHDGTYEDTLLKPSQAGVWEVFDINFTPGKFIVEVWWGVWSGPSTNAMALDAFNIQFKVDALVGTAPDVNLNVDIQAQTVGNIAIDIAAQTLGQLNVNIAASAVTLNVAIQSSAVTLDVNIAASAVTVNVNISSQTASLNVKTTGTEKVAIDVAAQTIAQLDVNIAAQAANVNVDIKAQTVDLNIKTSGGANIVIDKLTQTAYVERRTAISNRGTTALWGSTNANNRGKFFTRGCMGFLHRVSIYCKNGAPAGKTLTVYISPNPDLGYVAKADIAIPALADPDWRHAIFYRMWPYDKLFIWTYSADVNVMMGYDNEDGTKADAYRKAIAATTWNHVALSRWWFDVAMQGQTVGDVPVSGTVNTINIPSTSVGAESGSVTVPSETETSIITILGAGTIERVALFTGSDVVEIRFYVDGVMFDRYALLSGEYFTAENLNILTYGVSTPQIQLMSYAAGGMSYFNVTKPFSFQRSFEVRAYQVTGTAKAVRAGLVYDLLS